MTYIYLLIIEDRHSDVEVLPYSTEDAARAAIVKAVRDYANHPEDIVWELTDDMIAAGWVANVYYSDEGDSMRVVRRKIIEAT